MPISAHLSPAALTCSCSSSDSLWSSMYCMIQRRWDLFSSSALAAAFLTAACKQDVRHHSDTTWLCMEGVTWHCTVSVC